MFVGGTAESIQRVRLLRQMLPRVVRMSLCLSVVCHTRTPC